MCAGEYACEYSVIRNVSEVYLFGADMYYMDINSSGGGATLDIYIDTDYTYGLDVYCLPYDTCTVYCWDSYMDCTDYLTWHCSETATCNEEIYPDLYYGVDRYCYEGHECEGDYLGGYVKIVASSVDYAQ